MWTCAIFSWDTRSPRIHELCQLLTRWLSAPNWMWREIYQSSIVRPSCPKILIWEIPDCPPTSENYFLSKLHLLSKMIWSLFSFFRRNSMPAILGSYSRDLNMWGIILKSLSKKGNPNGMTTWISWLKDISLRFSSFFAEPNLICLVFCESFAKSAITWASV